MDIWACLCGKSDMVFAAYFFREEADAVTELQIPCTAESHMKVRLSEKQAINLVTELDSSRVEAFIRWLLDHRSLFRKFPCGRDYIHDRKADFSHAFAES